MKMSQFREGIFGRLESHDWGMPVYFRAAFMPDSWDLGAVGPTPLEDIGSATSRSRGHLQLSSVTEGGPGGIFNHVTSGSGEVPPAEERASLNLDP